MDSGLYLIFLTCGGRCEEGFGVQESDVVGIGLLSTDLKEGLWIGKNDVIRVQNTFKSEALFLRALGVPAQSSSKMNSIVIGNRKMQTISAGGKSMRIGVGKMGQVSGQRVNVG
jgi:hypothetical protein